MTANNYRLIFLSGAEGSGTTLLTRLLSSPDNVVTISGKHRTIPREDQEVFKLAKKFNDLTKTLWDRKGTMQAHLNAKLEMPKVIEKFSTYERYRHVTHLLMKRSAPFYKGDQYRPDIADVLDLFPNARIIFAYRDPRASTFSMYRREFVENLREAAVICEEQLTYFAAQLSTLSREMYRVVNYESFCAFPEKLATDLATFCELPLDVILKAIQEEKVDATRNDLWQKELTGEEINFLNDFFNSRRKAQWKLLEA